MCSSLEMKTSLDCLMLTPRELIIFLCPLSAAPTLSKQERVYNKSCPLCQIYEVYAELIHSSDRSIQDVGKFRKSSEDSILPLFKIDV